MCFRACSQGSAFLKDAMETLSVSPAVSVRLLIFLSAQPAFSMAIHLRPPWRREIEAAFGSNRFSAALPLQSLDYSFFSFPLANQSTPAVIIRIAAALPIMPVSSRPERSMRRSIPATARIASRMPTMTEAVVSSGWFFQAEYTAGKPCRHSFVP